MKYKRHLTAGVLTLTLAAVVALCFYLWPERKPWPQIPLTQGVVPSVVVAVEPDFGYRIGDIVPVTIYVRQAPKTTVDVGSLALEGDFEIVGEPDVQVIDAQDGGKILRVKLSLQSFAYKKALSSRLSMSFNVQGEKQDREIPRTSFEVHTSPTWDGREVLQEGTQTIWQGHHLAVTLAFVILGLCGMCGGTFLVIRLRRQIPAPEVPVTPLTPRQIAVRDFNAVWAKISRGDRGPENFREIDRILRKLLLIETVLLKHIDMALGQNHPYLSQVQLVIGKCEAVMFKGDELGKEDLVSIKEAVADILLRR